MRYLKEFCIFYGHKQKDVKKWDKPQLLDALEAFDERFEPKAKMVEAVNKQLACNIPREAGLLFGLTPNYIDVLDKSKKVQTLLLKSEAYKVAMFNIYGKIAVLRPIQDVDGYISYEEAKAYHKAQAEANAKEFSEWANNAFKIMFAK